MTFQRPIAYVLLVRDAERDASFWRAAILSHALEEDIEGLERVKTGLSRTARHDQDDFFQSLVR